MVNFLRPRRHRKAKPVRLLAGPSGLRAGSGIAAENSGSHHGGRVPMRARLNALFAFSVNSPSMSMVNFSCCVVSVLSIGAHRVTRRVTPRPMRAEFGTEAGVDVQL